jgi:hypothetical protein
VNYDEAVLLEYIEGTHELLPCGLQWRKLVKLFKKTKSRFYWFDFTVRGQRYRGSTGETKAVRATKVASMKLARALEHGDLFPSKPAVLAEFSERFLAWLDEARLEEKTKKYYRNGGRLLKVTPIFGTRLTEITSEAADKLTFSGSCPIICISAGRLTPRLILTDCMGNNNIKILPPGCGNNCPPSPELLYAASPNHLLAFTIDQSTGALSAPSVVAGPNQSTGIAGTMSVGQT